MAQETNTARPPMRMWLRVLLAVSLALNLLILGLVGGAILRLGGPDGLRRPPHTIGTALYRELPSEDRRALRSGSGDRRGDHVARQKADTMAVSTALRATPFDAESLGVILSQQAARRAGFQDAVQQAWLTRVAAMSDADRLAYADRLEQAMNRSWSRNRRDRSGHD